MFSFPEHMVLLNPLSATAYAMKYKERYKVVKTVSVENKKSAHLLIDEIIQCSVCEAVFLLAPYIKVIGSQKHRDELGDARFTVEIDSEMAVNRELLEDYLTDKHGVVPASAWKKPPAKSILFLAMPSGKKETKDAIGIWAPNGTWVKVRLEDLPPGKFTLETGFIAAVYTTSAAPQAGSRGTLLEAEAPMKG